MRLDDHFLHGFFHPQSVALVGASNNPLKSSYKVAQNLVNMDFPGRIYLINPREDEILGQKAYPRLQDVPDQVDLVISAVQPQATMDVARDCATAGIKRLVVVSGGFSEAGNSGRKLNEELSALVKEKGIRTLGPNTLTPINSANQLAVSFHQIKNLRRGALSFVFQSGFYEPKIGWMFSHLRINKMLDLGNKMNINEVDALEYMALDPDTKVLALHIESIRGDGRDFFRLLKEVAGRIPVIVLKSGRTAAGSQAAASHTGGMAQEDDVILDGLIKQAGAVRAQNVEEFFDLAKAFNLLAPPRGRNMAVITNSGGEGVMAVDSCETHGFKVAELGSQTRRRLASIMPPWDIPLNPFDSGVCMQFHMSDFITFLETLAAIPQDENVDCTIMHMLPISSYFSMVGQAPAANDDQQFIEAFIQAIMKTKEAGKTFALWRAAMDAKEQQLIEIFESRGLPVFQSSERAVKALDVMARKFNSGWQGHLLE